MENLSFDQLTDTWFWIPEVIYTSPFPGKETAGFRD